MTPSDYPAAIILAAAVVGALALLWKTTKRARKAWRHGKVALVAFFTTIAGRDEVRDPARPGVVLAEALPSMGARLDAVEKTGAKTHEVLEHIATLIEGQQKQDLRLEDHGQRILALEVASVERVAGHIDSAAAWRAMEAVASTPGDPDTEL